MANRSPTPACDASAVAPETDPRLPGAKRGRLVARLTPHHGEEPVEVAVDYACHGNPAAPVVVVQGGISAHRDPCASSDGPERPWWPEVCGPGAAIDTRRCRVLSIDYAWGEAFSAAGAVATFDQAEALAQLLAHLRIPRIAAFVGASYGAMVGLAFAARHPLRVARLIAISGAHRAHPIAIAWRGIQRRIVALGIRHGAAAEGLALARELAMTTYRTEAEFGLRFADAPERRPEGYSFPVDDYLHAAGARFAGSCAVERFLQLSASLDLHSVEPDGIRVPTTLVAVRSDRLVPLDDMGALAARLSGPIDLVELDSLYGHDAFLKEPAAIGRILRSALCPDPGLVSHPTQTGDPP